MAKKKAAGRGKKASKKAPKAPAKATSGHEWVIDELADPGQGTDTTQAGHELYRAIKRGEIDPTMSTPKPRPRKKAAS